MEGEKHVTLKGIKHWAVTSPPGKPDLQFKIWRYGELAGEKVGGSPILVEVPEECTPEEAIELWKSFPWRDNEAVTGFYLMYPPTSDDGKHYAVTLVYGEGDMGSLSEE